MRKWFWLILVVLAGALASVYLFTPGKITLLQTEGMATNVNGFSRNFIDERQWQQWWPGDVLTPNRKHFGSYRYNGKTFTVIEKTQTSITLSIKDGIDSILTELIFLPLSPDSISLSWKGQILLSTSPIKRLSHYGETKAIEQDLAFILQKIKAFYTNEKNIYGIEIIKDFVVDSTLISTSITTKNYPSVETIYQLIDQLKAFARKKGAKQTGLPMLNITSDDSLTYLTKVALPVDKKLKDEGNIVYRWMLGGGNILVTEVKGGPYTINAAFERIEKYVEDHKRVAPAIPFQSLVTNRREVKDTAQWITRLYWPVM